MEDITLNVSVEVKVKEDGRFYYNVLTQKGMDSEMIRSVLAGALALTIRGEETPEQQGKALRDVINYLEEEFISVDSFTDIYTEFSKKEKK